MDKDTVAKLRAALAADPDSVRVGTIIECLAWDAIDDSDLRELEQYAAIIASEVLGRTQPSVETQQLWYAGQLQGLALVAHLKLMRQAALRHDAIHKGCALERQQDCDDHERNRRSITTRLNDLEVLLALSEKLAKAGELEKCLIRNVEQVVQQAFKMLELATYELGVDLRQSMFAEHPLKKLWDRWNACKERMAAVVDEFKKHNQPKVK